MDGVREMAALLRIVRGTASEEELAAVTVTLCSLLAARGGTGRGGQEHVERSVARWRQWERAVAYQAPHSWR